jgi:hypothetical protein
MSVSVHEVEVLARQCMVHQGVLTRITRLHDPAYDSRWTVGAMRGFRPKLALKNTIGSHTSSLDALACE